MPAIHVDCGSLSQEELSDLCEHLSNQTGVTKIGIQTSWASIDETEDGEEPLILNVGVSESHWRSITEGTSETPEEQAAKWFISLLLLWKGAGREMIVGYDETENIVILGNPGDW